eukprot:3937520-Rhodomonas_salina.1
MVDFFNSKQTWEKDKTAKSKLRTDLVVEAADLGGDTQIYEPPPAPVQDPKGAPKRVRKRARKEVAGDDDEAGASRFTRIEPFNTASPAPPLFVPWTRIDDEAGGPCTIIVPY